MAPNDEKPFTPRSPFVLKRSNLTLDGVGRLGQDLNHTWVFTGPLAFDYDGRYGLWQCGGGTVEAGPDRIAYRNVQVGAAMNADLT